MSYLSRLKRIDNDGNFTHSPQPVLTEPPKAPFVSFGSSTEKAYATISAANSSQRIGAGDMATSWGWRLHFADRDPMTVLVVPHVTHAEILEQHPDALAAEPYNPTTRQPSRPMSADEEKAIRAWLAQIEETDAATIAGVLHQCQHDANARNYFLRQSNEPESADRGDKFDSPPFSGH